MEPTGAHESSPCDSLPPSSPATPPAQPFWRAGCLAHGFCHRQRLSTQSCAPCKATRIPAELYGWGIKSRPRDSPFLPASAGIIKSSCSQQDIFQFIPWQGMAYTTGTHQQSSIGPTQILSDGGAFGGGRAGKWGSPRDKGRPLRDRETAHQKLLVSWGLPDQTGKGRKLSLVI